MLALLLPLPALPATASAQSGPDPPPEAEEPGASVEGKAEAEDGGRRAWWSGWSVAPPDDRLALGMWTLHPFEHDFPEFANNWGVGLQHGTFFALTFVNSYGRRTVAAGVERSWIDGSWGPLRGMLGFRAGLVYGYDEELLDVAGRIPVIPAGQLLGLMQMGPVGAEITYVYRAISIMAAFYF